MALLEVKNLAYTYPNSPVPVWEKVSFELHRGELLLLAGDCGSGKSTLLKCLCGVIPQLLQGDLEGEVLVGGKKVATSNPGEIARQVGVLWQNVEAQILQQYVEDELVFGLENLSLPPDQMEKRLEGILPLVQLERHWPVPSLSGGQKQRLIIGSVLLAQPSVLLLDEPLANLDPPAAQRLLEFLQHLCRQGTAVIMAEHRLELAAPYARRCFFLEGGRLVERRNCEEIAGSMFSKETATASSAKKNDRPVLEIDGLTVSYGKQTLIRELELRLRGGESVVILGQNGSGKSTLLKTLCGIKRESAVIFKSFMVNGKKVKRLPANLSEVTGLVMQNPHHQLFMESVRREIGFGSVSETVVEDILKLFHLHELSERHPFSLSQGQKRLLALAATLSHRPPLLLLDEPTIGQDHASLDRMLKVLRYLAQEWQTAIITATHDRRAAVQLADRVILLEQGQKPLYGGRELIDAYFDNSPAVLGNCHQ